MSTGLNGKIMTVTGPIEPEAMGVTLPHEHLMSTFGDERMRYPSYEWEDLHTVVISYLAKLKDLGCQTIVDCTAAYFGRQPEYLQTLSQESGLHVLTNTGYYGASYGRYVPPHAYDEPAEKVASRWVWEWEMGIDGTGVYPGFIKTAVGDGPLSEINHKLILAAAKTHLETGLTIQTHMGDNTKAAFQTLEALIAEGVHPSAWIWVHAHSLPNPEPAIQAAEMGAWISFDGITQESAPHILEMTQSMKRAGLLDKVLLSHDGDTYCMGAFRAYHYLFTDFIDQLRQSGFSLEEIKQMTVANPREAFTISIRGE